MATSAARMAPLVLPKQSSPSMPLRLARTCRLRNDLLLQRMQQLPKQRRQYSSSSQRGNGKSNTKAILGASVALTILVGGYYLYSTTKSSKIPLPQTIPVPEVHPKKGSAGQSIGLFNPTVEDYQKVYNAIATKLWKEDEYDDGSYGPVVLRLSFHASGTYDAETGTGGSNGATMRFAPESEHGANSGLVAARNFLEPIKEMQGPAVPWRPGRNDRDESYCSPDGRLPDGSKGQNHIRAIFGRMGFNDQEIVALLGAHGLERSGFDGPWTFSPTVLTNEYYRLLIEEKWDWRSWKGPKQWQDASTKSLMMLPADMALVQDPDFKKHVERYAEDRDAFFHDFSNAMIKMLELGVPFKTEASARMTFATLVEQAVGDDA